MATARQRTAARRNINKAQARSRKGSITPRRRIPAPPESRARKKPGTTGRGKYFHVAVRAKSDFVTFRTQDVGERGHIQRVAGKRSSGSWSTVKWLISKEDAHLSRGHLVPDTTDARQVLTQLGSKPIRTKGDHFEARPRPNVPEDAKPTPAQRRARRQNIQKAQAARRRQQAR